MVSTSSARNELPLATLRNSSAERLTDAKDMFAYSKDPEWSLYLGRRMPRPYLRRNADEYVAKRILAPWDSNPTFAMVLDTTVIGGVDLKKRESSDDAELGYGVARTHWRKDLMAEAAHAVVDWGFKNLGLAANGLYVPTALSTTFLTSPEASPHTKTSCRPKNNADSSHTT